jgi:hypothetical protein
LLKAKDAPPDGFAPLLLEMRLFDAERFFETEGA